MASDTMIRIEKKVCDDLGRQTKEDPHAGYMLFPNETPLTEVDNIGIDQNEINKAVEMWDGLLRAHLRRFIAVLVCCVDYRVPFGERHHQTRQAFTMPIYVPDLSKMPNDDTPVKTLVQPTLERSFWGNSAD
jgi:hypothetical protein